MSQTYTVQVTDQAYGGKVPERAWRVLSTHRTPKGAYQAWTRAYRWRHPEPACWTGHVRVLDEAGRLLQLVREYDGIHVYTLEG